MRVTCFLAHVLFVTVAHPIAAQTNHSWLVMGALSTGTGSQWLSNASLDVVAPSDYFFSVGGLAQTKTSRNIPLDFYSGVFSDPKPRQYTRMVTLRFGKVLKKSLPRCRVVLSAGIGAGRFSEPVNFVAQPKDPLSVGTFYRYTRTRKAVVGALFTPTVEFPVGRRVGFSTGLVLNINNGPDWAWALCLALKFGHVRDGIVKK